MTRARMTQVMNLPNLSPTLQDAYLTGELNAIEHDLRQLLRQPCWDAQRADFP